MKRSVVLSVALLSLASVGPTGCAHTYLAAKRSGGPLVQRPRAFALAVTVAGGLQPTPAQWAAIQAKFAADLATRGWVLVTDLDLADHIIRVHFVPDAIDPENSGRVTVVGIRSNSRSTIARRGTGPFPGGVGYASFSSNAWMNASGFSSGYFGYTDFYNNGYSYYTPVTPVAPPAKPPYKRPPGHRDDCPPSLIGGLPVRGDIGTHPINDHPRPPPRDLGRFPSDRVAFAHVVNSGYDSRPEWSARAAARSENPSWRSSASYSRSESGSSTSSNFPKAEPIYTHSESNYQRYEPSPARSDPSPASSYSAPDVSFSAPPPAAVTYSAPAASENPEN